MKITRETGTIQSIDTDQQQLVLQGINHESGRSETRTFKYHTSTNQDELEKKIGKMVAFILHDGIIVRFDT